MDIVHDIQKIGEEAVVNEERQTPQPILSQEELDANVDLGE